MNTKPTYAVSRRSLLRAIASAPLWHAIPARAIETAADAFDVFDLEAVARGKLPPAHWAYLATGTDSELTLNENTAAFSRWYLRPRRLVDVRAPDLTTKILGESWPSPLALTPLSSQRAFDPEGEVATARAARAGGYRMILSNVASVGVEEVTAACGESVWMQLYATARWDVARAVMRRAEAAGSRIIVLTVDLPTYSNRLTLLRGMRADTRDCTACHGGSPGRDQHLKPMYAGTGLRADEFRASGLTWEFLQRMRDSTHMQILVKGIVTREDAVRCLAAGVDGIIVSNHGGRSDDTGRAAIDSLPEVVAVAGGKVPVLVDSGFRRGTDVLKALALGASAVNIGRPYAWGLAAFGESGVARAMEIIRTELETNMRLVGAPSIADIGPDLVAHA